MPSPIEEARNRVRATAGALRLATDAARDELADKGTIPERIWLLCDQLHDALSMQLGELETAERRMGLR